jgi:hypothetical protein
LSGAQLVVDKSRVVLKLAEGILEVVKLGLDVAKGTIEIAKTAVKGVKFLVGAALHVARPSDTRIPNPTLLTHFHFHPWHTNLMTCSNSA